MLSIVIPVRNEARGIRSCLDSWLCQTVPVNEIVVIDSGSTDGTLEIVREYPKVKLIQIQPAEFNHGATRNRAMQYVTGEFTLMTVGDARAVDAKVLERLHNGFDSDRVAGVCGLQIVPHELDKNPVEWFRPVSSPVRKSFSFASPAEFDGLLPDQKRDAASWDDVIAMYRTTILRDQIPFREITYGEDPVWAIDALRAGHTLVYDPSARVYHYHLENADVTYRRAITMLCLRNRIFGTSPQISSPTFRSRLSLILTLVNARGLSIRERWKWYRFNKANQRAFRAANIDFLDALQQGPERVTTLHDGCAGKPFKIAAVG